VRREDVFEFSPNRFDEGETERIADAPAPSRHPRSYSLRQLLTVVVVGALFGAAAAMVVARTSGWGKETTITRYVTPRSVLNERPADIHTIVLQVLPGVVSISATTTTASPFFGTQAGSQTTTAMGTGMIVSANGEVVTNDHVVDGASSITVTLNGSSSPLQATLVGRSPQNDLALLQIHGTGSLSPVVFGDSTRTLVGDDVIAIGYALGLSGGPTVTDGIISALGRQVATQTSEGANSTLQNMIQTDAAISSGNSGGPLVNAAAQVIGITTVVATSSRSATAQNIGFAIPSQTVEALLPQLRRGGTAG
jgi:putative serine protease PepD